MTADTLFNIANLFAALGWLIIIVLSPLLKNWDKIVVGIISALLAAAYTYANLSNFRPDLLKKFATLDGISEIFQNKYILTACWLHFLAFDLIVAFWIKRNAEKHGINHALLIVPLLFTCMLGPLGFLLYLLVRTFCTGNYFATNGI